MRAFALAPTCTLLCALALSPAAGATAWVGGSAASSGFGVHAGASLLRVPLLGSLGIEGAAEAGLRGGASRYAAGLTLRDLNLPLTRVDAFATVGAEYRGTPALYAEGGLRGPLLGPAGWRGFLRMNSAGRVGAGVGIELRF